MALTATVTSATPADGTFSATGATVWNAGMSGPVTGTLDVADGGTGATTLTGILLGTGTTAVTAIANSSTVGQVLRVTGAAAYAWGALDLANGNAYTGALPASNGGTGITGLATGMATWFASGTAVDLRSLTTGTTGSGSLVFATSPAFTTPDIGTPSAGVLTNATGLPLATGVTGQLPLANGGTAANLSDPNADRILFWDDSAGAVTWLTAGTGLTITNTTMTASGGASLDAITAAAADQAGIANADWNIVWNWQKTTNNETAFTFGETAASTNGTSNDGVPNQVLLKLATVAASTMSPLSVYSRANHVFSVSRTTAQILATVGSKSAPVYSFALSSLNTGFFATTDPLLGVTVEGVEVWRWGRDGGTPNANLSQTGAFPSSPPGIFNVYSTSGVNHYLTHASANATGVELYTRKARGTPTAPTVITTGDDLFVINAYGYVGGNNAYQLAASIVFDSTGTIADTTTGIGGILRFNAAKVGAEPVEILRLLAGTTTGGGWAVLNEADASPVAGDLADGDEVAVYFKAGKLAFAQNVAGTVNFLHIPIDGSTTTWTADTTGP